MYIHLSYRAYWLSVHGRPVLLSGAPHFDQHILLMFIPSWEYQTIDPQQIEYFKSLQLVIQLEEKNYSLAAEATLWNPSSMIFIFRRQLTVCSKLGYIQVLQNPCVNHDMSPPFSDISKFHKVLRVRSIRHKQLIQGRTVNLWDGLTWYPHEIPLNLIKTH